jgi:plastocyanin
MKKALLVLLIILLQIGVASAGIDVRNATAVWNATFATGPSVNVTDRITVEYANSIYISNLTLGPDPSVPDRIVIDHANAVYKPYLNATPPDFNPIVSPRIVILAANSLWFPKLSLSGIAFVDIRDFAFNKSVITIPVNTTVTWINFDSVTHTVTANDGSFDSGNLPTNQSFSRMFNVSGTFAYHCSIHPSMTGSVIVTSENPPPANATNFDTGSGGYPSISGLHKGSVTLTQSLTVHRLYTYPSPGTGGHSEYAAFYYPNGTLLANGTWSGYTGDWHNITIAPFTLEAGVTYNYTLRTGSYPMIIHANNITNSVGTMTSTEFIDANGRRYQDWIPAIRLE